MGTFTTPVSFSTHFGVSREALTELGVLDPVLNVDTKLFVDPILLKQSGHGDFAKEAINLLHKHFGAVIKLLQAVKERDTRDVAWRTAKNMLSFPEFAETCLGYGDGSIRGSGFGKKHGAQLLDTAKQVVDLGIDDPDLFQLLPLIEEGVGPDLISDMTCHVIRPALARLTQWVVDELKIDHLEVDIAGERFRLPANPLLGEGRYVMLAPLDILRDLPVATCWSEVEDIASQNAQLRKETSALINEIFAAMTRSSRKEKRERRQIVLASVKNFEALLELLHESEFDSYDLAFDEKGKLAWREAQEKLAKEFPVDLQSKEPPSPKEAIRIVNQIIEHFRDVVENKGLWQLFWNPGKKPRNERNAQLIFFGMADAWCKANNLDVTPEAHTGTGPVDFKFAAGYNARILVEAKLTSNRKLTHGLSTQLLAYAKGEKPIHSVYLVIDVGGLTKNVETELFNRKKALLDEFSVEVEFIDATPQASASKR